MLGFAQPGQFAHIVPSEARDVALALPVGAWPHYEPVRRAANRRRDAHEILLQQEHRAAVMRAVIVDNAIDFALVSSIHAFKGYFIDD